MPGHTIAMSAERVATNHTEETSQPELTFSDLFFNDGIFLVTLRPATPDHDEIYEGFLQHLDSKVPPTQSVADIDAETVRKSMTCVICQENVKSMMYTPCRHVCVCQKCGSEHKKYSNKCPLCNTPFHGLVHVFV